MPALLPYGTDCDLMRMRADTSSSVERTLRAVASRPLPSHTVLMLPPAKTVDLSDAPVAAAAAVVKPSPIAPKQSGVSISPKKKSTTKAASPPSKKMSTISAGNGADNNSIDLSPRRDTPSTPTAAKAIDDAEDMAMSWDRAADAPPIDTSAVRAELRAKDTTKAAAPPVAAPATAAVASSNKDAPIALDDDEKNEVEGGGSISNVPDAMDEVDSLVPLIAPPTDAKKPAGRLVRGAELTAEQREAIAERQRAASSKRKSKLDGLVGLRRQSAAIKDDAKRPARKKAAAAPKSVLDDEAEESDADARSSGDEEEDDGPDEYKMDGFVVEGPDSEGDDEEATRAMARAAMGALAGGKATSSAKPKPAARRPSPNILPSDDDDEEDDSDFNSESQAEEDKTAVGRGERDEEPSGDGGSPTASIRAVIETRQKRRASEAAGGKSGSSKRGGGARVDLDSDNDDRPTVPGVAPEEAGDMEEAELKLRAVEALFGASATNSAFDGERLTDRMQNLFTDTKAAVDEKLRKAIEDAGDAAAPPTTDAELAALTPAHSYENWRRFREAVLLIAARVFLEVGNTLEQIVNEGADTEARRKRALAAVKRSVDNALEWCTSKVSAPKDVADAMTAARRARTCAGADLFARLVPAIALHSCEVTLPSSSNGASGAQRPRCQFTGRELKPGERVYLMRAMIDPRRAGAAYTNNIVATGADEWPEAMTTGNNSSSATPLVKDFYVGRHNGKRPTYYVALATLLWSRITSFDYLVTMLVEWRRKRVEGGARWARSAKNAHLCLLDLDREDPVDGFIGAMYARQVLIDTVVGAMLRVPAAATKANNVPTTTTTSSSK